MATSAFKSTTKRTPVGGADDSSSGASASSSSTNRNLRRSRSLSRFSRRILDTEMEVEAPEYNKNVPRGKFVNTTRGSEVPEISLDDLALEFFSSAKINIEEKESESVQRREGRSSTRRSSEVGRWASDTASSRTRGRSVSRHRSSGTGAGAGGGGGGGGNGKSVVGSNASGKVVNTDAHSRRRRSLSVARYQISDSESDVDRSRSFGNRGNIKNINGGSGSQISSLSNAVVPSGRRLGRSLSQKDLSLLHDGYSSHSSALTDDEIKEACMNKHGTEKTIRAVYAQKKAEHPEDGRSGLYEVMRKELRHAVEEIRTELEQGRDRRNTTLPADDGLQEKRMDARQTFAVVKQNYSTKLEQSEKRKQELLAEIVMEEQRGRELSKIVREIVSSSKSSTVAQRPARTRKRSKDQNRMSKQLVDEAEKYFEDFISSLEDTDISSFDGERSDASSTLGGSSIKGRDGRTCVEAFQSPAGSNLHPVETDGIILPWLQWETSNDASLLEKSKMQTPVTPKALQWENEQEMNAIQDRSSHSINSHESWNPALFNVHLMNTKEESGSKIREFEGGHKRPQFDMDEYRNLQRAEELLFERYSERHRIDSGGLLLCTHVL